MNESKFSTGDMVRVINGPYLTHFGKVIGVGTSAQAEIFAVELAIGKLECFDAYKLELVKPELNEYGLTDDQMDDLIATVNNSRIPQAFTAAVQTLAMQYDEKFNRSIAKTVILYSAAIDLPAAIAYVVREEQLDPMDMHDLCDACFTIVTEYVRYEYGKMERPAWLTKQERGG